MGPIIVAITLGIPAAILAEATLAYIGVGVQAPRASWGSLIADGQKSSGRRPHLVLFPAICIALALISFTFLGDGLRDALDPEAEGEAVGGERPTRTSPPPNAPTIIELSRRTTCPRARTEAVAKAGVGRKADAPARGPRPVDPLLHARRGRPGGRRRQLRRAATARRSGLVGESGCGKSVTALSIARLVPDPPGKIVAGSILFDGIDVLKLSNDGHAQAARQGDRVHLPGPADQPEPDADHRLPDRARRSASTWACPTQGRPRPGRRAAGEGRHPARQGTARATTRSSSRAGCASA